MSLRYTHSGIVCMFAKVSVFAFLHSIYKMYMEVDASVGKARTAATYRFHAYHIYVRLCALSFL